VFALIVFAGLGAVAWDAGGTPASDMFLAATLCTAVQKYLFTTREARAALGCGETKLYQLINDGTLDARRLGRRTYITAESIERFVQSLERVTTPTMAKLSMSAGQGAAKLGRNMRRAARTRQNEGRAMSVDPPKTPTAVRLRLFEAGFQPLPLQGKYPSVNGKDWQKKRLETNPDEIRYWGRVYPYALGTGVLTRNTPFLDADILAPDAAEAVEQFVKERFDGHPVLTRIGQWPKRAFPFQTTARFPKIKIDLISPDGTDTKQEKIELLCEGQQCTVGGPSSGY
jgi:excisionase family DNA binding protein